MATIICDNCGTENPDNVKFCKQCGNRLPVTVAAAPTYSSVAAAASQPAGSIEKRYGALRGIANLCYILAIVFAVLSFVGGMGSYLFVSAFISGMLGSGGGFFSLIGTLIVSLVSAAITYIFWRVIGESIMVLLDIEENTRRVAMK